MNSIDTDSDSERDSMNIPPIQSVEDFWGKCFGILVEGRVTSLVARGSNLRNYPVAQVLSSPQRRGS